MSKPKLALYWAASCGRLRNRRARRGGKDPRRGRFLRHRLLAVRHGLQVQGRGSHGGRQHRSVPFQRRHPHQRERGDGAPAAAQGQGAGGLRFLRPRGLHPGPGQPHHPRGDPGLGLSSLAQHRQPERRPPAAASARAGGRARDPGVLRGSANAGAGRPGGLLRARLPAPAAPDRQRAHRHHDRRAPAAARLGHRGGRETCCDECGRKREEKRVKRFYRPWEIVADPNQCLLDQGIICLGPATAQRLRRAAASRPTCPAAAATGRRPTSWTRAPR